MVGPGRYIRHPGSDVDHGCFTLCFVLIVMGGGYHGGGEGPKYCIRLVLTMTSLLIIYTLQSDY